MTKEVKNPRRMTIVESLIGWAFQQGMSTAAGAAIQYCATVGCAVRIEDLGQYPDVLEFFDDEAAAVAEAARRGVSYKLHDLPGYKAEPGRPDMMLAALQHVAKHMQVHSHDDQAVLNEVKAAIVQAGGEVPARA